MWSLRLQHLALLLAFAGCALSLGSSRFHFKLNQLYEVTVGLETVQGLPLALGDFRGTLQTDLLVATGDDQKTVELWAWQPLLKRFEHQTDLRFDVAVSNVIPADFNNDGHLDMLVMGSATAQSPISMWLYVGNGTGFTRSETLAQAEGSLPFAFSRDGATVDLLGAANQTVRVWANNNGVFEPEGFADTACRPANPHSSAFVDLNGDCAPDLFIVCEGNEEYQIWTQGAGFTLAQTGKLPSSAGPVSFADISGSGSLDMIIPIVGKPQIYVVYNKQRPICTGSSTKGGCRRAAMCEADTEFGFDVAAAHVVDISAMWPGETMMATVAGKGYVAPPPVRAGDLDLDGYPDLVFVTKGKSGSQVRILKSVPGSPRAFEPVTKGVGALDHLQAQDVALLDLDGSGTVDLLIYYLDSRKAPRISAIYNNFFTDAFFIKAQTSSSIPGSSFKYLLVSDAGHKHVAQAAQLPQTAYRMLSPPYTITGIGRTNNYIEDFAVGAGGGTRSFEGLIPNSHVVVFPSNSSAWRLELFMNRSESTPYILATLLSSMLVLAITVFALGALERKADRREKERALHSINFDAL
ncbi:hypothetical protein GGI25_005152 [Coemansia spiralis]|uniref:T-cell immunomodulatory protein TIP C2 domain-containing protein n=2 Tax=Coemansia TaxID=4863 RepID=A0A9W8FZ50_9FUNG|nr:hypothetical protein EDC05_005084 [Coemansia umbellata]KAJ2620047.1 hypothetical protein GGI26_005341 [Coemansia sp. RSA 1358]KAJ2672390.1 hypothetical protein GGI25_005152 [Coemansia spiralis]